ncbi:DEAD/DEAH box helicase [Acidomonas methanolica]|uniref:DEAD/DEAH box helicase n=1 Tax=Acidomonas methanolica TaxID=437 RepID=UPI00211A3789
MSVEAPEPVKRGRGRPRKVAAAPSPVTAVAVSTETMTETETRPARRGRPSKASAKPSVETVEKPVRRGRPRKTESAAAAPVETPQVEDQPKPVVARRRTRSRRSDPVPETVTHAVQEPPETTVTPSEETSLPPVEASVPDDQPLFAQLGLSEPVMRAIDEKGYLHPTPIQAAAIPVVLQGRDVLGVAQTGTGKTASFTLPMLERLAGSRARARMPRSLILEPTRELALQVAENFTAYGKYLRLNHALLIGGESMADQRAVLNQGVDVLIATPGRLIDLFDRGGLLLNQTRLLVIDEADRMLDMGFIPDIERIVSLLPQERQTLFFSATMAPEIRRLADRFLSEPEEITVTRSASVATTIESGLLVVDEDDKRRALRKLLRHEDVQNAIVFCNRKRDVDVLYKSLHKHHFAAGHLHGDLPQSVRTKTLERFKAGELKILVCSDVAARGIDISGLSHVFNFDLPFHAEDYVHRIGRTGRAGKTGHAYSLATPYQKPLLDAIETLIGKPIPQPVIDGIETLPWADPDAVPPRRDHKRGERRGAGRPRDAREPDRRASDRREPDRREPDRRENGRADARRRDEPQRDHARGETGKASASVTPVVEFDPHTPPTGFGSETPAFMLLPRRSPVRQAEGERQGPVQHRGEA